MAQTAAARLLSTEDVVLEILHRVSTDVAALFRCAGTCKQWRALVADRCFLRGCWPENVLLGFFDRQHMFNNLTSKYRLFFVPPPAGSVLGTQRRRLTSIVDALPDDDTSFPVPLAARQGLLLVRLVSGIRYNGLVQMAVCDMLGRTCHILPPLECRSTFVSCTVLTSAECGPQQRSLNYFKVLAVEFCRKPKNKDDQEFNVYTFSSTEPRWSTSTNCYGIHKRVLRFSQISNGNIVCGGNAHWLVTFFDGDESLKYFTLNVSVHTGHSSLIELPFLTNLSSTTDFESSPTLGATSDGSLTLFCVQKEVHIRQLHMWKHIDREFWLHTKAIELNLSRQPNGLWGVHILPLEKSVTLFIIDDYGCIHKINVETGIVEEQQFQNAPSILAVPMNIEWSTLFVSRLG